MAELIVTGNLAGDPIVRKTATDRSVANLRVIESRRKRDAAGAWVDDVPLALNVTAWGELADNIGRTLRRGDRVTVHGRLVPTSWTDDAGVTKYGVELVAEDVAGSLRFATAVLSRTARTEPATAGAPY